MSICCLDGSTFALGKLNFIYEMVLLYPVQSYTVKPVQQAALKK